MKWYQIVIWLAVAALVCAACQREGNRMQITSVVYSVDSGPVAPEFQWHEEMRISPGGVEFSRSGRVSDSMVNAGTWEVPVSSDDTTELFQAIESADCAKMKRVDPEVPPEGGGTRSYVIQYSNGKTCTLYFSPGTVYTLGEAVTLPIDRFVQGLTLPEPARSQAKP